jgi:hypothetical protein
VVASRVAQIGQRLLYARLKVRNRLRETLCAKFDELLSQSSRRLLSSDLDDRIQILSYLSIEEAGT